MKTFTHTLIAVLFFSLTANAAERIQTYVEQDYGNEKIQGLKYVNDKAKEFIAEYNKQYNSHWQTIEPNAKILVSKCAVQLKARWNENIVDSSNYRPEIAVYCDKTVSDIPEMKKWKIKVKVIDAK